MRYDIVPIKQKYRGMDRSLLATDLLTLKSKSEFDKLLNTYYTYLECIEENISDTGLKSLIHIYEEFKKFGVPCEIIVFDSIPHKNVFGYQIELLGIDIVHDMCESLLSDDINSCIYHLLNENGLCKTEQDVEKIIPFQDCGNVEWSPCYVYELVRNNSERFQESPDKCVG